MADRREARIRQVPLLCGIHTEKELYPDTAH